MQDTFYLPNKKDGSKEVEDSNVLRTQTSCVQIRTMQNEEPPIKIIAPGRVYRSDYDATHTPMFHQVEGLVIDKKSNMSDLKGVLNEFLKQFFELDGDIPMRFRPSYFPFTEPSAEVDIGCSKKGGELKIGAGDDWLEILGCGMVNQAVLRNVGIDPDVYQGYAFGMGIDRLAMLKYGIPDLRTFFETDMRWLKHYGFVPLDIPSVTNGLSSNGGSAR
jgi:phenylalanyl-tRNA synthetase alpha chain